jgi:hypothetical protein
MLPNLVWPNFDKFSYIGHTSGGVDPERMPVLEKQYPGVLDDPANIKRVRFFLGNGANDPSSVSAKNLAAELKRRGYSATLFLTNGIHGWSSFRRCFAEFAKVVFR